MSESQAVLCRHWQDQGRVTGGDGKKPVAMLCRERFCEDAARRFPREMCLLQPELVERVDYLAQDRVNAIVLWCRGQLNLPWPPDYSVVTRQCRHSVLPEGGVPGKAVLDDNGFVRFPGIRKVISFIVR